MPKVISSFLFFIFLCFASSIFAQDELPETVDAFEKKYQERIKREYLFYPPVYIPRDLTDAFIQLNKLTDTESKAKFKAMSEEDVRQKLFFSLGRWIVQNWGFYGGSRLSHYMKQLGIHHPEDMAVFIMVAYHRNLNRRSLDIKELVTGFKEKREKEKEARKSKGTIIHEETRKRVPPPEEN